MLFFSLIISLNKFNDIIILLGDEPMMFLMNGYLLGGIIASSIILIILSVCIICYRLSFYNERKTHNFYFPSGEEYKCFKPFMKQLVEEQELIPFEEIYINTKDKKKLFGRYYHVKDSTILEIQFHGYKGTGIRDFCGGNKLSRELKHSSILVDQRGHGNSSGSTIAFGIKEKYDVLEWINYSINRFGKDVKIILCGVSMGAATILMASELELPSNVIGIIADCPYSSPKEIIRKVIKEDMKLPVNLCYPFVVLAGLIFGGFSLKEKGAEYAVKNTNIPICLIHGSSDSFVPPYMSENIYNNCNSEIKELHLFEKAEHGISYIIDPKKYALIVEKFIDRVLEENKNGVV